MPLQGEYAASPAKWVRENVEKYERSNGAEGNSPPIVIVAMRGVKSGKIRKIPVMRVEHDGTYLAVASLGGAPKNPVWYQNLIAEPLVELRDRDQVWDVRARLVSGEERALWWERAVATFSPYAEYQQKTDREIPVFVLERVDAQ